MLTGHNSQNLPKRNRPSAVAQVVSGDCFAEPFAQRLQGVTLKRQRVAAPLPRPQPLTAHAGVALVLHFLPGLSGPVAVRSHRIAGAGGGSGQRVARRHRGTKAGRGRGSGAGREFAGRCGSAQVGRVLAGADRRVPLTIRPNGGRMCWRAAARRKTGRVRCGRARLTRPILVSRCRGAVGQGRAAGHSEPGE